jgi:PAS domain S-box-containing protein
MESDAIQASAEIAVLRDRLRTLSTSMRAFTAASLDLGGLQAAIVRHVSEVLHDYCILLLVSEDAQELVLGAVYDADPEMVERVDTLFRQQRFRIDEQDITRQVLTSGEPFFEPRVELERIRHQTTPEYFAFVESIGLHSVMVVPLRAGDVELGTLSLGRYRPHRPPFDATDAALARDLADQASLALATARLHARTQREQQERLRAEARLAQAEELRRAQGDLVRANQFLHAIIENIPDMIFVKDAERLSFHMFNKAGEDLLGIARTELLGKNDFDFFPPADAEFFQAKDRETLRQGKLLDIAEEPLETRHGRRWLHTKKVPIVDDTGAPLYLLGISQDITEQKEADAALQQAMDEAKTANRELESFSYSVAHDLRAPLRSVDGFSQALLEDYGDKLDDEGRGLLHHVRSAAQQMGHLIDDLLALSRVTRTELRRQSVDLSALVRNLLRQLQDEEPERPAEIEVAEGLVAACDPHLVAIALDNLLRNAWKFSRKKARTRIRFGAEPRPEGLVFFVQDEGAGFEMAHSAKLFGVFQRLHGNAEFEGTGIGLATVERITRRHGGRIWADGEVDRGATFYFTLQEPA